MNAAQLLDELRARGVIVEAAGDRLRVDAPKGAMSPELREALTAQKSEILALVTISEDEIAWRVAAMLPQIPEEGPIPFLVARGCIQPGPNCCHSCGDCLSNGSWYICGPCGRAKHRALEIVMHKR